MIGLGAQEIVILALMGGGLIAVALVVFLLARRGSRAADLEAENRRLRDELDRRDNRE